MGNSAESVTSGVYAPFTQQGYALLFECVRKVWTYHGVPSMQRGVFWPGKRAVSAWRQACAERTHFCEGVVDFDEALANVSSAGPLPSLQYRGCFYPPLRRAILAFRVGRSPGMAEGRG